MQAVDVLLGRFFRLLLGCAPYGGTEVCGLAEFGEFHPGSDLFGRGIVGAVRRGQGYTLRVSAIPTVHCGLLARCQPLDGNQGAPTVPAQRKARREYENRVSALAPIGP